MHQETETNYLMQYVAPMGTEVKAHDVKYEYDGQIVMATPHVIVVLLDHATVPITFCPISMHQTIYTGDSCTKLEGGLNLSAVPHGIQLQ